MGATIATTTGVCECNVMKFHEVILAPFVGSCGSCSKQGVPIAPLRRLHARDSFTVRYLTPQGAAGGAGGVEGGVGGHKGLQRWQVRGEGECTGWVEGRGYCCRFKATGEGTVSYSALVPATGVAVTLPDNRPPKYK